MTTSTKGQRDVIIIGAGPAGLATAGRLRDAGVDFVMLEQGEHVGTSWHNHYDRLHLHTIKKWSHLPGMPFPDDYPTYVSRSQLVDYFEAYARHYSLTPVFNTTINKVVKEGNSWRVESNSGTWFATRVVVATGVNRIPNVPVWSGQDDFEGSIVHSAFYKNPSPYIGQKVLVVGMGNTGAEIALDLAEHGVEVYLSVRGPVNIVPRDLNGRPVQVTGKLLEKLPFGIGDSIGAMVQNLYFGDLSAYGLTRSKVKPAVQLRETGKTPVIDIGTIKAIKEGRISVVGEISKFNKSSVFFRSGDEIEVDSIILATGYSSGIRNIVDGVDGFLDTLGYPRSPIGDGAFAGLYFVGFNNYVLGGILGTIYDDSSAVVDHIVAANV